MLDYDLATPNMLLRYFPTGILGLGLTALLASFMSGMAGNVTAFNTVWTYDIYQSYIRKKRSRRTLSMDGPIGHSRRDPALDGAAYAAMSFNNIMDTLQLVFAFVNAPLFATFLLGMFWKRTTGHAAFTGLISGTLAAIVHHGLTLAREAHRRHSRRLDRRVHHYPSDMAQNFWTAIWAFLVNLVVTFVVSLLTAARTTRSWWAWSTRSLPSRVEHQMAWYARPIIIAVGLIALVVTLNLIFR